jgi:hypothetical protein
MGDPRMTEHVGGPESPDKLRYERLEGGDRMFKIVCVARGAGGGSVGFLDEGVARRAGLRGRLNGRAGVQGPRHRGGGDRAGGPSSPSGTTSTTSCTPSRPATTRRQPRFVASSASSCSRRASSSSRRGTSRPAMTGAWTCARLATATIAAQGSPSRPRSPGSLLRRSPQIRARPTGCEVLEIGVGSRRLGGVLTRRSSFPSYSRRRWSLPMLCPSRPAACARVTGTPRCRRDRSSCPSRGDLRVSRAQRSRQDDDDADAARTDPARRGEPSGCLAVTPRATSWRPGRG